MKRNKIFLGTTASLLALAGVVAAKQQKHPVIVHFTTANFDCTVTCAKSSVGSVTTLNVGQGRAFVAGGHIACYTVDSGEFCLPLYTGI